MEEQQRVLTPEGKLRTGLYKVFLFKEIRDSIKSGALAIESSYDYRSFEEYIIPAGIWQKEKESLIQQAGITAYAHPRATLLELNQKLNAQIKKTNEQLAENKQVYFDAAGNWHLMKEKRAEEEPESESPYPQDYVIPLLEVLTVVEEVCGFYFCF